jgi:hypothetical protein
MARPCPACGRPNADTAVKCLYCVAPLPPAEARAPAAVEAPSERHLLILLPSGARDETAISALSRIAGVSTYDARLSLSAARPRLFRRVDQESEARRLSQELTIVGIAHYVVSEASVLSLPITRASAFDFGESRVDITSEGSVAPAAYGNLFLLVRGEITRERHDERKVGSAKGASRRLTPGMRLHLYTRDATAALEVDPDLFDFRFLEEDRTASSILNLEKLIARLLQSAPSVLLDRGFDQEPLVLSRAGAEDVTDALAVTDRGPSGVPYDDEASFRFYSRWRFRVARHLDRRESG